MTRQPSCGHLGVQLPGSLGSPAKLRRWSQTSRWAGRCADREWGNSRPGCQGFTCRDLGILHLGTASIARLRRAVTPPSRTVTNRASPARPRLRFLAMCPSAATQARCSTMDSSKCWKNRWVRGLAGAMGQWYRATNSPRHQRDFLVYRVLCREISDLARSACSTMPSAAPLRTSSFAREMAAASALA